MTTGQLFSPIGKDVFYDWKSALAAAVGHQSRTARKGAYHPQAGGQDACGRVVNPVCDCLYSVRGTDFHRDLTLCRRLCSLGRLEFRLCRVARRRRRGLPAVGLLLLGAQIHMHRHHHYCHDNRFPGHTYLPNRLVHADCRLVYYAVHRHRRHGTRGLDAPRRHADAHRHGFGRGLRLLLQIGAVALVRPIQPGAQLRDHTYG